MRFLRQRPAGCGAAPIPGLAAFEQDRARRSERETDTIHSAGTTSSPRSTGIAEKPNHKPRHASSLKGHEPLPSPSALPLQSPSGTKCGQGWHPLRPGRPAIPCGTGSLAGAPIQSLFWVVGIFRFVEPIALVRSSWAIDVPRFVEVFMEPSPRVSRKTLLETRPRAAPPDGFPQNGVDFIPLDPGIARRGVRAKRWRARWARVTLVFLATQIPCSRCRVVRRFVTVPRSNPTTLSSSMPHD